MDAPALFTSGQVVNDTFLNQNVRDKIVELQGFNSTVMGTVVKSTATNLTQSTWVKLGGGTVTRKLGGTWATGSTADFLKIPVTGWYQISAYTSFGSGSQNTRRLFGVALNSAGSPTSFIVRQDNLVATIDDLQVALSGEAFFTAGQDIALWAWSNSASPYLAKFDFTLRLVSPDVLA